MNDLDFKKTHKFFLLSLPILFGLILLFFTLSPAARAQNTEIYVDKQLGNPSPVVHVGQYLTFTIEIENRTNFTVTTLPLSDTFDMNVLGYVDAVPPPDTMDLANGRLDWTDLTTHFGDLGPGQTVWVVVGFTAEHPAPVVVNRAEVHDALSDQGQIGGGDDDSSEGESIGGASPVDKRMIGDVEPAVGRPLTFTIAITNNGYTTMTAVPLTEDYDPAFLQFSFAVPQPDIVDEVSGELFWSDLTTWFGDVSPFSAIQITAVFTALAPIDVTTNHASVSGASDWYGNDLDAGADQVPIAIIDSSQQNTPTPTSPAATSTPAPTNTPGSSNNQPTPTQPTATATAEATAVRAQALPDTGIPPESANAVSWLWLTAVALLPICLWGWLRRKHLR